MRTDDAGSEADRPIEPAVPAAEGAPAPTGEELRALLRDAVAEALGEQRELIQSIVEEALQDLAWSDARREFDGHDRRAGRPAGFRAVDGEA
jgi:hypothetical protein